jgi:hypothetical protein
MARHTIEMSPAPERSAEELFRLQGRRAGRAVEWLPRTLFGASVGVILSLCGLVFAPSLPWLGIPIMALGIAICGYAVWWGCVGRFRILICPNCGVRGEIIRDEWAYLYHCPKCGGTADTGVGIRETSCDH